MKLLPAVLLLSLYFPSSLGFPAKRYGEHHNVQAVSEIQALASINRLIYELIGHCYDHCSPQGQLEAQLQQCTGQAINIKSMSKY
jgi:hypothetical protein